MTDTEHEQTVALRDLVAWAESQGCKHTARIFGVGGDVYCPPCGRWWSDEDGGFRPDPVAPEILRARELLAPPPDMVDPDAVEKEICVALGFRWEKIGPLRRVELRTIAAWHRGKMAAEWEAAIEAALLSIKTEGVLRAIHAVANLTRVPAP